MASIRSPLPLMDVRVRRLELDGLDLRLRVAGDGALSLAVASDSGATPIPLPGGVAAGGGAAALPLSSAPPPTPWPAPPQALDRLTLAHGHFEIENEATQRSVVYKDFAVTFDHSGSTGARHDLGDRSGGTLDDRGAGFGGRRDDLSVQGHDLSLADLQAFDKKPPPLTAEGPIAFKLDAELSPGVDAARFHRPVHRRRRTGADQQPRRGALFYRRSDRRHRLG